MMEFLRQLEVFSPYNFEKKRIDVIGVGATGSYVAWLLSKIGLANIHVWDDDAIVAHNLPNQHFFVSQIGLPKVSAVAEMLKSGADIAVTEHREKVVSPQEFGPIVFLLVDSMEARKKIWEESIRYKLNVECMIETRMGADSGRIYTVNPSLPSHVKNWEATLCDDKDAETSACGASISIAPTATLVASYAIWQLIKRLNGDEAENEVVVSLRSLTTFTRMF